VIVKPGGHANEQGVGRPDIVVGVPDKLGDRHDRPLFFGTADFVNQTIRRRVRPLIVKNDFDSSLAQENAIVMLVVLVPSLHFAGPDRELVNVGEGRRMKTPIGPENFAKFAAVVDLGRAVADHNAVNQTADRLALRRDGFDILLWLHRHGDSPLWRERKAGHMPHLHTIIGKNGQSFAEYDELIEPKPISKLKKPQSWLDDIRTCGVDAKSGGRHHFVFPFHGHDEQMAVAVKSNRAGAGNAAC